MTKRMLIDATHAEETRVVVLDGSRLEDFDVETSTKRQLKGNIYLAKVVRVEPSLQAAFVEYGGNRHGFLAFGEIHPDYYQIPVADRQRLLAMEAEDARREEEEEDRAALNPHGTGNADAATEAAASEDAAEVPAEPGTRDEPGSSAEPETPTEPWTQNESEIYGAATAETETAAPDDMNSVASALASPAPIAPNSIAPDPIAPDPIAPELDRARLDRARLDRGRLDRGRLDRARTRLPQTMACRPAHPAGQSPRGSKWTRLAERSARQRPRTMRRTAWSMQRSCACRPRRRCRNLSRPCRRRNPSIQGRHSTPIPRTLRPRRPGNTAAITRSMAARTTPGTMRSRGAGHSDRAEHDQPYDAWNNGDNSAGHAGGNSAGQDVARESDRHDGAHTSARDADDAAGLDTEADDEDAQDAPPPETVGGDADNGEDARERRIPPRFLRNYKIQEVIRRRQILLVQVVKEERGTKGAALTTYISLAGRFSVLMPNSPRGGGISRKITSATDRRRLKEVTAELDIPDGMGLIVRTAGANRPKPEIKRDCEYLMRLWDEIRDLTMKSVAPALIYEEASLIKRSIRDVYSRDIDEILVDGEEGWKAARDFMRMLMPTHVKKVQLWREPTPLFARQQVEAQLDAMLSPTVQLRSGGYLVINQTEALVAIDVNSGRSTRERGIEETALRTNIEAVDEVARQLRLRDLAGLIVIDLIDMESRKNNATVERRLKEALKVDRARIQVGNISHFGLMEMSRQRLRPSLAETSFVTCPHCGGMGHVRGTESAAIHVLRDIEEEGAKRRAAEIMVRVASPIAMYILNHKRVRLGEIEARYAMHVTFVGDDSLIPPQIRVERVRAAIEAPVTVTQDARPEAEPPEESTAGDPVDLADDDEGEAEPEGRPADASAEGAGSEGANGEAGSAAAAEAERSRRRRRRRRGGRRDEGGSGVTAPYSGNASPGGTSGRAPPVGATSSATLPVVAPPNGAPPNGVLPMGLLPMGYLPMGQFPSA